MAVKKQQQIRVPNLPLGTMVDNAGVPTSSEMVIRQTLIRSLQKNFGNEGLVPPSQPNTPAPLPLPAPTPPDNPILKIQNNRVINQTTGQLEYTCQGGTLIYDSTNNQLLVCILDGSGVPTFKVVTVT